MQKSPGEEISEHVLREGAYARRGTRLALILSPLHRCFTMVSTTTEQVRNTAMNYLNASLTLC